MTNAFADHNAPLYIALQVVPSHTEGLPGEGKTQIFHAIGDHLKRRNVLLILSQMAPEDIAGMPSPDNKEGIVKMLPPYWFNDVKDAGGIIIADELTTPVPTVRAPALSLFSEGRIGQYRVHPDTLFVAASNPPEFAPNGSPLEPAMANRFFHWKWEMNKEQWLAGVLDPVAPLQWAPPAIPVVPSDWREYIGKWATLVGEFLKNHDGLYTTQPRDGELAFATYRTWTMAIKCLAAAEAAGGEMFTNNSLVRDMVKGCVGETAAHQFVTYKQSRDIVPVEDLLDGTATFTHNDNRPDITLCVAAAVTSTISVMSKFTPERWDRAAAIIGKIGTECSPEIALKHNLRLRDAAMKAKYSPNKKALKPLLDLMDVVDSLLATK